ncbi:MAG: DUF5666 domain-containing protein, partial [Pseudomonadota bacterium]
NDGSGAIDVSNLDPSFLPGNVPLVVEVFGFPTSFGVLATRIEADDDLTASTLGIIGVDDDEVEVTGFVDDVADDGSSIRINDAVFLIDTATEIDDDLTIDISLIDRFVEVEADIDAMGNFVAVEIDDAGLSSLDDEDDNVEIEIEGTLNSVDLSSDPNTIVINGETIPVDDASGLVDLVGQRVEVSGIIGVINGNGVLILDEVVLAAIASLQVQDRITSIDLGAGTFTTRLGIVIEPTIFSRNELDEDGGDRLTPEEFLSSLRVGDFVEALALIDENALPFWIRIEADQDEDDQECILSGPIGVGSIADPNFEIFDVTIDTTGLPDSAFAGEDDFATGRSQFFSLVEAGDFVEVESGEDGLGCTAGLLMTAADGEVSIEEDDGLFGNDDDGDDDPISGLELSGAIEAIDTEANTLVVSGETVFIFGSTLIDAEIVEAARGTEIDGDVFRFSELDETLDELFSIGDVVEVDAARTGRAFEISLDDDDDDDDGENDGGEDGDGGGDDG